MAQPLPRLRNNLDLMPSPAPERPGLLIRDAYQYSDATLIFPPPLVECLGFFDGEGTELDLREALVRLTGQLDVSEVEQQIIGALDQSGFLENETYERMKQERHRHFAEARRREPAHAGAAYPDEPEALAEVMSAWMGGSADAAAAADGNLIAIAAPHVSPEGGWQSYQAAYRALNREHAGRTFVILGTSHYGEPAKFGLTRKPFLTPWGEAGIAQEMVDFLEKRAPGAVGMEDYCHSIEHSIEFQVVFLQHLYGPDIRILPVLCGSYARSIYGGGKPESDDGVKAFLEALGELTHVHSGKLLFVLGIDMAHMGRRYGDRFAAYAERGEMREVADRDKRRIERMVAGDPDGFWSLVQEKQDDLKWCGSSPVYTFLKAVPEARGQLQRYEQWNIDEQSVVSFAGVTFTKEPDAKG